jgi:hypothetical protein
MGIYNGLNATQCDLRDRVCLAATTLEGRLRALGQQSWHGADRADVETVRGWPVVRRRGGRHRTDRSAGRRARSGTASTRLVESGLRVINNSDGWGALANQVLRLSSPAHGGWTMLHERACHQTLRGTMLFSMPMCGSWAIASGRWPPPELSGGERLAGSPASGSARPPTPGAGGGQKASDVSR